MSNNNGTGVDPKSMLRDDKEARKNRILGNQEVLSKTKEKKKDNRVSGSWKVDLPVRPKKKTFTQVRIEDPIIIGLKEFIRKNKVDISYTSIVNTVTRKFLEENGINIKE